MLSNRTARWVAGTALLCVAVLGLSWLLLLSPTRTEAAELRDQNAATQTKNDLLEVKIAQLRAQFAKLPESQAELASILTQLPADAGMPRLVRDLDAMSKSSGGGEERGGAPSQPPPPGAGQTLSSEPDKPATAGTTKAGTAKAGSAATDPSVVVAVPVTVAIDGDYFETVAFLKQLQTQMPRAFLVTAVQMAAGSEGGADAAATGGQVAVTITGKVFALPGLGAEVLTTGTGTGTGNGTGTGTGKAAGARGGAGAGAGDGPMGSVPAPTTPAPTTAAPTTPAPTATATTAAAARVVS